MKQLSVFLLIIFSHCIWISNGDVFESDYPIDPEVIVGGEEALPNEFPWMVKLNIELEGGNHSICGGILIDWDVVLTAAHCCCETEKEPALAISPWRIWASVESYRTNITAINVTIHEHFNYTKEPLHVRAINDIALIKLKDEFRQINGLKITAPGVLNAKQNGTIVGWGKTQNNSSFPEKLMKAQINVTEGTSCYNMIVANSSVFCARAEGVSTCFGDSGGPYINSGIVAGLTSFSRDCAPGDIGTYAYLRFFLYSFAKYIIQCEIFDRCLY